MNTPSFPPKLELSSGIAVMFKRGLSSVQQTMRPYFEEFLTLDNNLTAHCL